MSRYLGVRASPASRQSARNSTHPFMYDWNAFYGGLHVGYGFGQSDVGFDGNPANDPNVEVAFNNRPVPRSINLDKDGVIGGLQIGYNWQANDRWLIGIEADYQLSGIDGSGRDYPPSEVFHHRLRWTQAHGKSWSNSELFEPGSATS